jgi:hypothetical protein
MGPLPVSKEIYKDAFLLAGPVSGKKGATFMNISKGPGEKIPEHRCLKINYKKVVDKFSE